MILREPANVLDPRMRTYWLIESLIVTGVAALIAVPVVTVIWLAGGSTAGWIAAAAGGLVVAGLGASAFVTPRLDYEHYRYEVTRLGLYVARGWLWRRWQIVPHARVQTVDTTAGPLLRAFGLVSVAVTTASSAGGTEIPGLPPDVAAELVTELSRRAGLEEGT